MQAVQSSLIRCGLMAALLAVSGCQSCSSPGRSNSGAGEPGAEPGAGDGALSAEISVIAVKDGDGEVVNGLSGFTRSPSALWAVPERAHLLIRAPLEATEAATATAIPIDGVPEGLDLESLAYLDGEPGQERFALGTEGICERNTHAILIVEVSAGRARVSRQLTVNLDAWDASCEDSHGIEGICRLMSDSAAGETGEVTLVAAIEHAETDGDGRRFAPVATVVLSTGAVGAHRVMLTSDSGKLSGLDCGGSGAGTEVWAIERHFEVARVLRFEVGKAGAGAAGGAALTKPEVVADVHSLTDDARRNFEGLVRLSDDQDDQIGLLVDNQWRTITGPNEVLRVTVPATP